MIKICKECGRPFETNNGNKKFCDRQHYRICVICGKQFEITRYHLTAKDAKTTCSKKCSIELRKRTNVYKYGGSSPASSRLIREKMKSTNLERYVVKHAAQSDIFKEKTKQTNLSKYGKEYYRQTDKGRQELKDRWNDPEYAHKVRSKVEATCLKRYGNRSSFGDEGIREKAKHTYKERTGYETPFSNPEVQRKSEETNLSKYGVRRPYQSPKIYQKVKNTTFQHFGVDNAMKSKIIQDKVKETCLSKYGNTCFLQSEKGKQAYQNAMKSRYGVSYFAQSKDWKLARMLDPSKIDNLMEFRENPSEFISKQFIKNPSLKELSAVLGIHENSVGQLIIEFGLQDKVKYVYSAVEDEVANFIYSVDNEIQLERNTHSVITPLELDLYLPEYHLGIECNPTSTHNSSVDAFTGKADTALKYDYHKNKTDMCEEKGIQLFHIFGYEWTYKKEIIKSMIANDLGFTSDKLYARNTEVCEITSNECREFLNKNHRQGNTFASIRLGLRDKKTNELVSVMTFNKIRSTIGKTDKFDGYELSRFCSKLNTSVVGGASKLFKHFLNKYPEVNIVSFSDKAHTSGKLYEVLGFHKVNESTPSYVWVNMQDDSYYNRVNCQKRNLKRLFHDSSIDIENKTEKQIMEEHGYAKVFDSGTIRWEYTIKSL